MPKFIDLNGQKFGQLTVLCKSSFKHFRNRCIYWKCRCDCGKIDIYNGAYLRNGDTQSCGCRKIAMHTKRLTKHGLYGTPTYQIWKGIVNRCTNKNEPAYPRYGGRGITVGDRWRNNFLNFLEDMGERPPDKSIDRINNSKGYFKENCRWTSPKTQARNTRRHVDIGEVRNGWEIIDRVTENNIYKAKAKCIKCNRIVIWETDNLTHRSCHCPSLP
jgi:hypothetical protein